MNRLATCSVLAALMACLTDAAATEAGTTGFPRGGEDFLVAAMPPPGWYAIAYATRYVADRLAGPEGDLPLEGFRVRVNALAPRVDWVKPATWLGADRWGTLLILPVLDVDVTLPLANGAQLHDKSTGIGDLVLGNGLHWTLGGGYEMVNALDIVAPTGSYDATRLANPGRNVWLVRASHMGTWLFPNADVSYRLHLDAHSENPDTHYRSGETIYFNYAAGWKPSPATTVGVAGYVLRQVTDDRGDNVPAGGNRIRAQGIGPALKHFLPGGLSLTAKYFHETSARNGPRGDSYWLYVAIPLA